MTNPPIPPSPVLPLPPDVRAAYDSLYATLQNEVENSADPIALQALNGPFTNVNNVLVKDDMYKLNANSALFDALLNQIKATNSDLSKLRQQISDVAAHFQTAGTIISAIDKVIGLVPRV